MIRFFVFSKEQLYFSTSFFVTNTGKIFAPGEFRTLGIFALLFLTRFWIISKRSIFTASSFWNQGLKSFRFLHATETCYCIVVVAMRETHVACPALVWYLWSPDGWFPAIWHVAILDTFHSRGAGHVQLAYSRSNKSSYQFCGSGSWHGIHFHTQYLLYKIFKKFNTIFTKTNPFT